MSTISAIRWSMPSSRLDEHRRGRTVLPVEYAAEYLDLGYAITAHRAQGVTVDTAHVVVTATTTRENLYVSMTRGRDANIAYVALDQPDETHATPEPDDVTARTVLYGVLQHSGASKSAHQTIEEEYAIHGGIDRLAAELETIAADAQPTASSTCSAGPALPMNSGPPSSIRRCSGHSRRRYAEPRPTTTTSTACSRA